MDGYLLKLSQIFPPPQTYLSSTHQFIALLLSSSGMRFDSNPGRCCLLAEGGAWLAQSFPHPARQSHS